MNIVGVMVGMSLMASAAPMVTQMAIAPAEASKRAQNFATAETAAVVFAATYEGGTDLPQNTDNCVADSKESSLNAYSVTCTHGDGKYTQNVTRAFRLAIPDCDDNDGNNGHGNSGGYDCSNPGGGYANNVRVFDYPSPPGFTAHQCLPTDNWGLDTAAFDRDKNKWKKKSCIPSDAWALVYYNNSDPNAWMYDINGHNGYGDHPDY
jgi:hypothetical protein